MHEDLQHADEGLGCGMASSTSSFLNRRTPGVYITENSVEPIDLDDRALAAAYQAIGSVIDDPQADAIRAEVERRRQSAAAR